MKKEILIEVNNVSKKFCVDLKRSLFYGLKDIFQAIFYKKQKNRILRKGEFWAVRNVSFTLKRGECLGLIGHNGAGKSTLLKMLNGLIKPDAGEIIIRGKIGALIELGAGFNPILTGRENIYNNGAVLGFTKKEIDQKFDAIVEYSELEEFIDMPVQNYSSGMKIRLGFAVAAQLEPDVLLIDEVLAVGDMGFLLKCLRTIDELLEKTAVIFVSHSMPMVSRITSQIQLMEKGKTLFHSSDVSKGIDIYYSTHGAEAPRHQVSENGELLSITFNKEDINSNETYQIQRLEDLVINITFKVVKQVHNPYVAVIFYDKEQRPVGIAKQYEATSLKNIYTTDQTYNYYNSRVTIPRINLSKGLYSITLTLSEDINTKVILRFQQVRVFQVIAEHEIWQPIEFETIWE